MPTLLADQHIPFLDELCNDRFRLIRYDSLSSLKTELSNADALLIRTVSKINPQTFPLFPEYLKFIGSASAGTDHVDIPHVEKNEITFAYSPGCNARSVAEYVITACLLAFDGDFSELKSKKVGILGFGHTGSQTAAIFSRLGISFVVCDPPLQSRDSSFKSADFNEFLSCDILTFHVPLTDDGPHPTRGILNDKHLNSRQYDLIINASRGGVINEKALIGALISGNVKKAAVDVWEDEPEMNPELLRLANPATPHIAGYSNQAKFRATQMVMEQLFGCFEIPIPELIEKQHNMKHIIAKDGLYSVIRRIHPAEKLSRTLKQNPDQFSDLRNKPKLREEFGSFMLENLPASENKIATALGFNIH